MSAPRRSSRLSSKQTAQSSPTKTPVKSKESEHLMEIDNGENGQESEILLLNDLKQNVHLLEKSVSQFEKRFAARVLRTNSTIRKKLTPATLEKAYDVFLPKASQVRSSLLAYVERGTATMEVDQAHVSTAEDHGAQPEIEVYFSILTMIYLLDQKSFEKGLKLSAETVAAIQKHNRRTLDPLAASAYYYNARFYELLGRMDECRPMLLSAQRTAVLRHDDETLATLINCILRNYLHFSLFDQADKFASKISFPEKAANNQSARYMYYLGLLRGTQLEYSEAYRYLLQATRKAPQTKASAGFQQSATKLSIIVQLLMGEIPERSLFRQMYLEQALVPYFHLTQAVRTGDLNKFQTSLSNYGAVYKRDKTFTLILRLRHNVIKTGLKMISVAYSRISLKDICIKLHLDSQEDAEYIVAKAIRDGVIEARIDHEQKFMKSKESINVYATAEPQNAIHQRIKFCLDLHNESVKAMRFSSAKDKSGQFNADAEDAEREQDIAELLEDEMDEDDDIGF